MLLLELLYGIGLTHPITTRVACSIQGTLAKGVVGCDLITNHAGAQDTQIGFIVIRQVDSGNEFKNFPLSITDCFYGIGGSR